jgi:hypothetical protein
MKKGTKRVGLPKRLQRVQVEAERAISRGYKAALETLPSGPRKVVKDFADQLEATAEELSERGEKILKQAEKRRKAFVARVDKAARAFERRGERVLTRGSKLVASFERAVADAVRPVARRLDIAALSELELLSKRLAQIERRLANGTRRAAA